MTSASSDQLPPGVSPNHPLGPLTELIGELRTETQTSAENGQSDDIGVCTITAGGPSEALVPVFLRCTWPAGARSRHKLIWMKPSIPEEAFATAANDAFQITEAGGEVERTRVLWGVINPFADPSAAAIASRNTVRRAVGLDHPPTQQQIIKMMEGTMNGIMQVVVKPARDAAECFVCRRPCPITREELDDIRESAFGPRIFCEDCVRGLGRDGIDRIFDEAEAEAKQRAVNSLSGPSG